MIPTHSHQLIPRKRSFHIFSPKRQFFLQTMNRATFDDVTDVKKPLKTKIITFPHFKVLDQEKKIVGLSKKKKSFVFRVPIFLFRFRFIFHFRFSNGMNLFKEMVSDCLSKSVFSSFDLALKTPKQNSGRRRNVADFFEKPFPLHETCYRDCERFFFLHQTSFSVR